MTILIVDDEPLIREILVTELQDAGFQVLEAESGNSAIRLLEQTKVNVIISDLRMPDGDGFSLLHAIQGGDSQPPIFLMMTGLLDHREEELKSQGVDGLILKPFDLAAVVDQLRMAIAEKPS